MNMPQNQPKDWSKFTIFITVITTLFIVFIAYKNMDNISEFFGSSNTGEVTSWLQIGQQIAMEWVITASGDLINYTHTLQTTSDGIFWLKSKSIDLTIYTGNISVEWTVEKEIEGVYIIEVTNIMGSTGSMTWEMIETGEIVPVWVYLEKAGIYFPESFFNEYTLLNSGENREIKIKNSTTNKEIKISYFQCQKWNESEDCAQLKKNFANMTERTVTTNNNDKFIKLAEMNSRFFTNDLFWYFINDVPAQDVVDLGNHLILPNKDYVNNNLLEQVPTLCVDGDTVLQTPEKNNLMIESNKIILKVTGKVNSGNAECKIIVNPSLPTFGEKLSFYYPELGTFTDEELTTMAATSTTTTDWNSLQAASDVKQFPINLEKALTYISSKWGYSVIFPSSNISYASYNVQTDLDTKGVNCYTQFNVIKFSDKANLEISPTVKIYECKIKNWSELPNMYATKSLEDGRVFVIEAIDPSRVDFANNIVVE